MVRRTELGEPAGWEDQQVKVGRLEPSWLERRSWRQLGGPTCRGEVSSQSREDLRVKQHDMAGRTGMHDTGNICGHQPMPD